MLSRGRGECEAEGISYLLIFSVRDFWMIEVLDAGVVTRSSDVLVGGRGALSGSGLHTTLAGRVYGWDSKHLLEL